MRINSKYLIDLFLFSKLAKFKPYTYDFRYKYILRFKKPDQFKGIRIYFICG